MRKVSRTICEPASRKLFERCIDDLQGLYMDLQFARRENLTIDAAVLEEEVLQMLREWKAEFYEPSPASSSQQGGSLGSFSTDIRRLSQLCDEEDDATSGDEEDDAKSDDEEDDATSGSVLPKLGPSGHKVEIRDNLVFQEVFNYGMIRLQIGHFLIFVLFVIGVFLGMIVKDIINKS